ncbi:hypothetical protein ACFYOK_10885 [Microbispora bryophytorum]|uniref:hypothetical protein n=1 Tax=Microbispora bryophytorum TaxID=1460882 RepID=UPI0033C1C8F4
MSALPAGINPIVRALPHAEWYVAITASDMPARPGAASPAQISEWIAQGVERLGEVEVWRRFDRTRALVSADESPKGLAEWRTLWPSRRRANTACDLAWRLHHFLADHGVRSGPIPRWREVPVAVSGREVWYERVNERDIEMVERLGELVKAGAA